MLLDRIRHEIDLAWCRPQRETRAQLRTRLAGAQNWRCCYCCGRMDGEREDPDSPCLEMIVPRTHGGDPSDVNNLAVACRECQEIRGEAIWPVHIAVMAAYG